ncbi:methyl-accepting chemotaxis protein [Leptothrix sp. BB-4]
MDALKSMLRQFTIRTRMNGAIAMVLALFIAFAGVGVAIGHHLQQLNHHFMTHSVAESGHVADLRATLGEIRIAEKNMVIDYDLPDQLKVHKAAWDAAHARLGKGLEEMLVGEEDEDNPIARDTLKRLQEYVATTTRAVDNTMAGAYDGHRTVDRVLERSKILMAGIVKNIEAIDQIVQNEAVQTQAELTDATQQALAVFGLALALVIVVVAPLTLLNSHSIVGPIDEARRFADAIAAGDLSVQLKVVGRDEPADLMRALGSMQQSLQGIVGNIRHTAESISVASAQIATGNQDLSGRTEQTASNLQHAASSMEQVSGTVRQTAESARTANQLASSAADAAHRGGDVVSQVITNMEEINTSSRRIAEIIGVIDGIAFQTNILALNAAVEAARAGEQGRGFAVVAGEVRNLAQRSANAAREIKGLIGASVEKVDSGARLVHDAGSTMTEIVSSVQRVTDIIGEITAATTEQSGELGQVSSAVNQLDQMTQQNAALVEESAAAAESLREQAQRLSSVVSQFRIDGSSASTAVPAPAKTWTSSTPPTQPRQVAQAPAAPVKAKVVAKAANQPVTKPVTKAAPIAPMTPAAPLAPAVTAPDDDWTSF